MSEIPSKILGEIAVGVTVEIISYEFLAKSLDESSKQFLEKSLKNVPGVFVRIF